MPRALLSVSLVLASCARVPGPCDPDAAREVVYTSDAQPIYAGQALLFGSCGYGVFCHSAQAAGSARFGAPHGLDFDVDPASYSSSPGEVARLVTTQRAAFDHRHAIWGHAQMGTMPPGARGRALLASPIRPRYTRSVEEHGGAPLPDLDSSAGVAILRNWLACDVPVVERSRDRNDGMPNVVGAQVEIAPCASAADCPFPGRSRCDVAAGRCARCESDAECAPIAGLPMCASGVCVAPAEANWLSIYEVVIAPHCAVEGCHGSSTDDQNADLDLRGREQAYERLFEVSQSEECGSLELPLVQRGDPMASLLVRKLSVVDPGCGDRMPYGGDPIPAQWADTISTWIRDGASGP